MGLRSFSSEKKYALLKTCFDQRKLANHLNVTAGRKKTNAAIQSTLLPL